MDTMKFGELLLRVKTFTTVKNSPIFAWAEDGDIALLGEAPEDFNGRVCSVKVLDEESPMFSRIYRDGKNVLLGYMDTFDVWKSYPAEDVQVLYEVLALIHPYSQRERPKTVDEWEKASNEAIEAAAEKFTWETFKQLRQRHVSGRTFDTLAAAFSIGYQAGKKEGAAG